MFETSDTWLAAWLVANGVRLTSTRADVDTVFFEFAAGDGTRIPRLIAEFASQPTPKFNAKIMLGSFTKVRRLAAKTPGRRTRTYGQQDAG